MQKKAHFIKIFSMLKENSKVIYDDRLNVIEVLIKLKTLNI